jgi:flavoprotein
VEILNLDEMINLIVEEVFNRLKSPPKNALVIFTGGTIGFNESIKQIKRLLDNDYRLNVVLSKSAEKILTPELIKDNLAVDTVYRESEVEDVNKLMANIDLLILPTLTMNSAAKIALCISDTLTTNIVSRAIMKGIEIFAVKDACDLENPIRPSLGFNKIPTKYMDRLKDYMKTMKEYGIILVDSYQLFNSIMGKENITDNNAVMKVTRDSEISLNKKVITREDIVKASQNKQKIILGDRTVITDLAREAIKEFDVKIIRKS